MIRIEEGEVSPVEYTIVSQEDIPAEALSLIREKREKEFQLTYQSGEDLYLIKGYGRQMTEDTVSQLRSWESWERSCVLKQSLWDLPKMPAESLLIHVL